MKPFKSHLKLLLAAAVLIMSAVLVSCTGTESKSCNNDRAKYIFLFIGDGMGQSNVAVTESYLSYKAGKLGGESLTFSKFPVFGTATTYSANKQITCSAAAATAMSCGQKTNNKNLCVDTEGKKLESLTYKLKDDGYKIGIFTTVPINHATPAAFYASNKIRYAYYEIAQQIPGSKFEFIGGNGFLNYYGEDNDKPAITSYLEENGSTVCFGRQEFNEEKENASQIVYCQPASRNTSAEAYTLEEKEENATLDQMMDMCLEFVATDDNPFFIMCEGGEIDWKAHANKTLAMIDDIIEFDNAIKKAYDFYLQHPDETLIIVTADHETGGVSLGGLSDGSKSGSGVYWDVIEESGNKQLTTEENMALNSSANIGWATRGHGGGPVPVYAIGKGSEKFAGRIDNTDIYKYILAE